MKKTFNNPIGLTLLTLMVLLVCLIIITTFFCVWAYSTQKHYKSEIDRMTPVEITTINETVKVVEKECPTCLWEDTPAQ